MSLNLNLLAHARQEQPPLNPPTPLEQVVQCYPLKSLPEPSQWWKTPDGVHLLLPQGWTPMVEAQPVSEREILEAHLLQVG